jgi:hypothetical protein
MTITPDESRLKELIKSAIVEAFDERRDLIAKPAPGLNWASTLKTIVFWVLILATAVNLYNMLEKR